MEVADLTNRRHFGRLYPLNELNALFANRAMIDGFDVSGADPLPRGPWLALRGAIAA